MLRKLLVEPLNLNIKVKVSPILFSVFDKTAYIALHARCMLISTKAFELYSVRSVFREESSRFEKLLCESTISLRDCVTGCLVVFASQITKATVYVLEIETITYRVVSDIVSDETVVFESFSKRHLQCRCWLKFTSTRKEALNRQNKLRTRAPTSCGKKALFLAPNPKNT